MSLDKKCVCGYEYYRSVFDDDDKKDTGNESFILIKGSYYIHERYRDNDERKVFLYVCPECGTVQMSTY